MMRRIPIVPILVCFGFLALLAMAILDIRREDAELQATLGSVPANSQTHIQDIPVSGVHRQTAKLMQGMERAGVLKEIPMLDWNTYVRVRGSIDGNLLGFSGKLGQYNYFAICWDSPQGQIVSEIPVSKLVVKIDPLRTQPTISFMFKVLVGPDYPESPFQPNMVIENDDMLVSATVTVSPKLRSQLIGRFLMPVNNVRSEVQ